MSARNDEPACAYVVGDDGLVRWSDTHAEAWVGFLEAHKRLTRALDAELDGEHGLTLSAVEVLGRVAADRAIAACACRSWPARRG